MTRIFLFISVMLLALPARAAWTLPEGEGKIIHNIFYYQADTLFNATSEEVDQPKFTKIEYNPYVEYGLTDKVMVGVSPRVQMLKAKQAGGETFEEFGLSDIEFFARYRLWQNAKNVVSIQPLLKLPTGYSAGENPALGSGQVDAEMRLLVGRNFSLFGRDHYSVTETAYRLRTDGVSDEWRLDTTLNMNVADDWDVLLQTNVAYSTERTIATDASRLINAEGYALYKGQLSVLYGLENGRKIQVGAFKHFGGSNTGGGGGVVVSLWQPFSWGK